MGVLFQLTDFVPQISNLAAEFPERGTIGFIVLSIIIAPVLVITIVSMLAAPRTFRIPVLFVGSVILLIGAFVSIFAITGWLLGFIVPG